MLAEGQSIAYEVNYVYDNISVHQCDTELRGGCFGVNYAMKLITFAIGPHGILLKSHSLFRLSFPSIFHIK